MLQTADDIKILNEKINYSAQFVTRITEELNKTIVGQTVMIERLLIGLLSNGHVLLEGVPGLAKTLAIKERSPYLAILKGSISAESTHFLSSSSFFIHS